MHASQGVARAGSHPPEWRSPRENETPCHPAASAAAAIAGRVGGPRSCRRCGTEWAVTEDRFFFVCEAFQFILGHSEFLCHVVTYVDMYVLCPAEIAESWCLRNTYLRLERVRSEDL